MQDSDGVFRGATGVNVSGDSNTVNIAGNVNMSAEFEQNSLIAGDTPLTGVTVNGANNDITLNGTFDINVGDLSTVSGQALSVIGLNVTGEGNNVDIRGGISITHSQNTDGSVSIVTGINLNGDSEVTLSGQSTIDTATMIGGAVTLAKVSNGGSLILDDNSIIDINVNYIDVSASINNALLVANGRKFINCEPRAISQATASIPLCASTMAQLSATAVRSWFTQPVTAAATIVLPLPAPTTQVR